MQKTKQCLATSLCRQINDGVPAPSEAFGEEAVPLLLALMFHCLLQPKEATSLCTKHFNVGKDMQWLSRQVGVVILMEPKNAPNGTQGAACDDRELVSFE
jgi:hypothetical protein